MLNNHFVTSFASKLQLQLPVTWLNVELVRQNQVLTSSKYSQMFIRSSNIAQDRLKMCYWKYLAYSYKILFQITEYLSDV